MTKERAFYIAYEICDYLRNCEMQKQFKDYEFCMYVSDLASEIKYANENNDNNGLKQYYDVLNDELENLYNMNDYIEEVNRLISLLDEWKN